jgi:dihydroxy-acid dehydratase
MLKELLPLLSGDARTVNGRTLAENVRESVNHAPHIIRKLADPIDREGGLAILHGNLCPKGAVLKRSAASAHLLRHRGRAVVFEDHRDLHARIDDPSLEVDETSVLVVKGMGPRGAPGMPEWGAAPIPRKLLARGVTDMVRISDARMSGTSYGTVVLHVAPEAAIGGPLALVRNGDPIELDVEARTLNLEVPEAELARRSSAWRPGPQRITRGYRKLFVDHVLQADEGMDFDFLRGRTDADEETRDEPTLE